MSDEIKKEREVKKEVKKDAAPDLAKQVANVVFTVRKMKNWLEEKLGADLDGDGRVGSGPYNKVKKLGVLLAVVGMAAVCSAAPYNTNIAVWVVDSSYIDENGGIHAPAMYVDDFTVVDDVTIDGSLDIGTTLGVDGIVSANSNLDIAVNGTVGGTFGVDGILSANSNLDVAAEANITGSISNTALTASKPVFTDSDKVLTSTGTVPVDQGGSGAATFTDGGLLVGAAAAAFEVLAVGTDGQTIIGASSANPTWQTITGLFSYNASGVAAGTAGYLLPAYNGTAVTNLSAANIAAAGTLPQLNGAALTALDAANITAGSVASAFNGGSITNIGDAAIVADSITAAKMATAVQTSLGLADTAAQAADVWGAPTATPSTNQLVNTVAIQAKNAAGGDLSEFRLIRIWTSETSMGAASTNNIETLVLSTGTAVDTVVAHADYRYVTATDGSAVATITGTATGTNYVMLSDGSSISATAVTFVP